MPRRVQPVEQERRAQRGSKQRPTDPHTHTGDRRTGDTDFISMVVGATNDRLPIDSHSDGRWITKPVTAATGRLEEMPEVTTKVETTADE